MTIAFSEKAKAAWIPMTSLAAEETVYLSDDYSGTGTSSDPYLFPIRFVNRSGKTEKVSLLIICERGGIYRIPEWDNEWYHPSKSTWLYLATSICRR